MDTTKEKLQKNLKLKRSRINKLILIPAVIILLVVFALLIYRIPAVYERLYWRVSSLRADIYYYFNPPEAIAFNPTQQGELDEVVASTLTAMAPTATQTPTITPTQVITPTPTQTQLPTQTPTPIPEAVKLAGIKFEGQDFNNCGPTNLSIALSYWGWKGDQFVTAKVLKPRIEDRNVMPYEMADYVLSQTGFNVVLRYGGDNEMLKRFIAGGFPVLIERGFEVAKKGWMGHYGVVYAYDDATQKFRIPDTYEGDRSIGYDELERYWGHFDRIYLVVYPPDRESEVMDILGPHADKDYNLRYAAEDAANRTYQAEGRELFFTWYSRGTILTQMADYYGASQAYDEAFAVYRNLPSEERPWRILWYQTGPFFAYYYTGRYYDVLALADQTLELSPEDAIPETWVWRGRAKSMLGDTSGAIADFRQALVWHPNWWVAEQELRNLGIEP